MQHEVEPADDRELVCGQCAIPCDVWSRLSVGFGVHGDEIIGVRHETEGVAVCSPGFGIVEGSDPADIV